METWETCLKHQKLSIGKTCGINYCIDCSEEDQEFYKNSTVSRGSKGKIIAYDNDHHITYVSSIDEIPEQFRHRILDGGLK